MTSYTITVDDEIWEKFKGMVTKRETLGDVIAQLIEAHVKKGEHKP